MADSFYTLKWLGDGLELIDQRVLPFKEVYIKCSSYLEVVEAIKKMVVRGAPAIGVAGAYALALAVISHKDEDFKEYLYTKAKEIERARPTAVNLSWSINRLLKLYEGLVSEQAPLDIIKECIIGEAVIIEQEDVKINKRIGENGSTLIKEGMNILTHCNAGALATTKYGTALSVITHSKNKNIHVYVGETRPFLQGARLTAFELSKEGVNHTLICDNMAAYLMNLGKIDAVVVGADRISKNGDTANKIGTYSLSVLAKYHKIPFYIAAPKSTIDLKCDTGKNIPIEERSWEEVSTICGVKICKEGTKIFNPSFDVTPFDLITAIITEEGIIYPPYIQSLKNIF